MHYVLQWNDPSTIYHVGVSVTLHWFILTRSILAPLSPTVLSSKIFYSLKSWSYFTFYYRLWFFFYELARMRKNSFFVYSQFTSSVLTSFFLFLGPTSFYLLEHERTERTRNLRGWKKSEADAYMMRLLLWPNGVWRRISPINATPTSWQFARVPGKRYAPTSWQGRTAYSWLGLS